MTLKNCPPVPDSLKPIQHFLTIASEHDERDGTVSYWCRLYAIQQGMKLDKSSPAAKTLLMFLMQWLEEYKKNFASNEAVTHDIPAQAHLENYALKLFLYADSQDRAGIFNKNTVKAFYTAGMIYTVLETFGELTEEVQNNRKYAKWKAAYIHNCLKNGEVPVPGPMAGEDDETENAMGFSMPQPGASNTPSGPGSSSGFIPPAAPGQAPGGSFIPPAAPAPGGNFIPPAAPGQIPFPSDSTSFNTFGPTAAVSPTPQPQNYNILPDGGDDANAKSVASESGALITPELIQKAQKHCKFAGSALTYDDVSTAIVNLKKALSILTTGRED